MSLSLFNFNKFQTNLGRQCFMIASGNLKQNLTTFCQAWHSHSGNTYFAKSWFENSLNSTRYSKRHVQLSANFPWCKLI